MTGNNALCLKASEQDIIERTDGIPLFVEEMTKAVLEAEDEGDARTTVAAFPSSSLPFPQACTPRSWRGSTGLGPLKKWRRSERRLAASFRIHCWPRWRSSLRQNSNRRSTVSLPAGLLFRQGAPPHATYLFKHALVQDAAYGTLLREPRRALHAHIADVLEHQFPEIAESQPELLARHCGEAGLTQQAIQYLQMAGERAVKRSANKEAVTHLQKARELLETLPDRDACADKELRVLIALGPALMGTRSSTAPEISSVYARARELAGNAGQLDPMIAGPEGGPSSDMQRFED